VLPPEEQHHMKKGGKQMTELAAQVLLGIWNTIRPLFIFGMSCLVSYLIIKLFGLLWTASRAVGFRLYMNLVNKRNAQND